MSDLIISDALGAASAKPLFMRVSDMLVREIAAGRLVDGQRLPPERELAAQFSVAVGTLRKALSELEAQGLLSRVQGSGNYVRGAGLRDHLYGMFRLELPGGGGMPGADLLSLEVLKKPADLPQFGCAAHASRIRRVRRLDGQAVALEEIWLDGAAGTLDPKALSASLYRSYQEQLDLWVSRAEDRVDLAPAPDWSGKDWSGKEACPAPGTLAGHVRRFSWAAAPEPVEFSRTWFDPRRANYVQRLS